MSNTEVSQIIDFGVNHAFIGEVVSRDEYNSKLNEVLLVKDTQGFYHLMQSIDFSKEFNLYNSFRFNSKVIPDYRITYEVLDAALITNSKVMFL